jgi:hypothetical protein
MAAKPSDTLNWVATGKRTDPGVTLRTNGYDPTNRLRAQHLNFIYKLLTDWIKYLSDQVFAGDVEVTNNLIVDNDIGATGDVNAGGDSLIGGTLTATHVVTGDADVKHNSRTVVLSGPNFLPKRPSANASSLVDAGVVAAWGSLATETWLGGLAGLQVGERILGAKVRVKDSGSSTMTFKLWKSTYGAATQLGATQTSGGAGVDQELSISGLTEVVAAGTMYYIEVACTGVITHTFYGGQYTVDRV